MCRATAANAMTATIAERKTLTVIGSKMTSAEYGVKVKSGETAEIENAVTFGGGVPVYLENRLDPDDDAAALERMLVSLPARHA